VTHTNGSAAGPGAARQPSFRRAAKLVARALLLRCPNCGRGSVLRDWFHMRERCSVCQVWLEREEGYFVGAMAINIVVGEFLPFFGAIAALILTWPTPPWQALQIAVPVSMALCPVILFPFSRTLWLALDWTFRPPSRDNRLDHPRPGAYRGAA
jgi:uncharacterized protein (DUF983 family)